MRFTPTLSVLLFAWLAFRPAIASPSPRVLKPRRTSSILNNPLGQGGLPSLFEASQAATAASLNLSNIQGDILIGMKKTVQVFYFFRISDSGRFRNRLNDFMPKITTTRDLLAVQDQPNTLINIAFSQRGLNAMGVFDSLNDTFFSAGQLPDATFLGDPGTGNWVSAFTGTSIHGLFIFASDSINNINDEISNLGEHFDFSLRKVYSLQGQARPGNQLGHEHFGYLDGISQPAITGFTAKPLPGQTVIDPGHILLGETGDVSSRPTWAKDGAFLAFRQLKQLVPEFNKFLLDNPIIEPGLTAQQGSDLLGARMIGRWKSGAPVDLAPLFDDPSLGGDAQRNNNFTFLHPGEDNKSNQTRCPFSAHVRKTAPRGDFATVNINNHIMRSGLPFGPEVSSQEAQSHTSSSDPSSERGLAFVAYQSNIGNGFRFLQHSWANNVGFFFDKTDKTPGFDPIIGANGGQPRIVSGLDPTNSTRDITLVTDFVQSRGGEYFFSPSISAISTVFSRDHSFF